MKRIDMLREARALIESGEEFFICAAIHMVGWRNDARAEAREIRTEIEVALVGRLTLDTWLLQELGMLKMPAGDRPKPYRSLTIGENDLNRQIRLAWLDRMIADLEQA